MDHIHAINDALDYIEHRLTQVIDMDDVAVATAIPVSTSVVCSWHYLGKRRPPTSANAGSPKQPVNSSNPTSPSSILHWTIAFSRRKHFRGPSRKCFATRRAPIASGAG